MIDKRALDRWIEGNPDEQDEDYWQPDLDPAMCYICLNSPSIAPGEMCESCNESWNRHTAEEDTVKQKRFWAFTGRDSYDGVRRPVSTPIPVTDLGPGPVQGSRKVRLNKDGNGYRRNSHVIISISDFWELDHGIYRLVDC